MAAHPEKTNEYAKRWSKANPEKVRAMHAKRRENNIEVRIKDRANASKWAKLHPEARRIQEQNREAKKRENGGVLSKGLAEKLIKLQRGKCACGCKQPLGDDYHLDHRMPISLGGANEDWNIQLLRRICNIKKGKKHPVEFMQQRGFLL